MLWRYLPALALVLSAAVDAAPSSLALPADWYPESLAAGPDGSFYVGSWRQGAVVRLAPPDYRPRILVPPGSNGLANAQGVLVDARQGALWVCSGNIGHTTVPSTPSALKQYALATGAPRGSYAMPDAGYCNDLAQDTRGNILVTDSLHPRILVLPPHGQALRVWKSDASWGTGDTAQAMGTMHMTLNGIAVDGRDNVYASFVAATDKVVRIARNPDGSAGESTPVAAPRRLNNADAIRWIAPDRLLIFESNAFGDGAPYGGGISIGRVAGNRITNLQPLANGLNDPSSGLVHDGRIWFIESKYGLLLSRDDARVPRDVPFDLQSVPLPAGSTAHGN